MSVKNEFMNVIGDILLDTNFDADEEEIINRGLELMEIGEAKVTKSVDKTVDRSWVPSYDLTKREIKDMVRRAIYDGIVSSDVDAMSGYEKKLLYVNKVVQKLIDNYYNE